MKIFLLIFACLSLPLLAVEKEDDLSLVRDDLYEHQGDLFLKTQALVPRPTGLSESSNAKELSFHKSKPESSRKNFPHIGDIYRNFFGQAPWGEEAEPLTLLKDVVDKKTWRQISGDFYRDKNNVYFREYNSDGGYLVKVEGLDASKVMFYEGGKWVKWDIASKSKGAKTYQRHYISDGKKVYFETKFMEKADFSSFKTMPRFEGFTSISYASDKNAVYNEGAKFTEQEYKNLTSNILDAEGKLINASDEHLTWVRAFNSLLEGSKFPAIPIPASKGTKK